MKSATSHQVSLGRIELHGLAGDKERPTLGVGVVPGALAPRDPALLSAWRRT